MNRVLAFFCVVISLTVGLTAHTDALAERTYCHTRVTSVPPGGSVRVSICLAFRENGQMVNDNSVLEGNPPMICSYRMAVGTQGKFVSSDCGPYTDSYTLSLDEQTLTDSNGTQYLHVISR